MYNKVEKYILKHKMLEGCHHVVTGLSGGADSVCLLLILDKLSKNMNFEITAVHVHHGIRGDEADHDRDLCRKLCNRIGITLREYYFDVPKYSEENGITCEEAGRILRYQSFNEEAGRFSDSRIAVAHHMNDQAETVIFNMCRGSGLRGIRGMQPVHENIIRPLLCCNRMEIEEFLKENEIEYCIDSTNLLTDYSRNKLRHDVIPYLEQNVNNQAVKNIAGLADKVNAAESYIEKLTLDKVNTYIHAEEGGVLLTNLQNEDEFMAKRLIMHAVSKVIGGMKDITDQHISQIYDLISANNGAAVDIRKNFIIEKDQDGIFIGKKIADKEKNPIDIEVPSVITPWDSGQTYSFELISWTNHKKFSNEVYTKYLDYDKIKFGLQLRTRRTGDYIVVDDKGSTKKLKDYFINEKVPKRKRDNVVLLADGSKIVWVIGSRIGSDYKIDKDTKTVLKVKYGGLDNGKS